MEGTNCLAFAGADLNELSMFVENLRQHSPETLTGYMRSVPDKAVGELIEVALKHNLSVRQMQISTTVAVEHLKNSKIYKNVPNVSGSTIENENPVSGGVD